MNPMMLAAGTAMAGSYVGLNVASRLIAILFAKGLLTHDEAAATLTEIAEKTREDAAGTAAEEPARAYTAWLEEVAETYRTKQAADHPKAKPDLRLVDPEA